MSLQAAADWSDDWTIVCRGYRLEAAAIASGAIVAVHRTADDV